MIRAGFLAAMAAMPLLSGCVAAAIPVIAAGGVLRTQTDGERQAPADRGPPRVAVDMTSPTQDANAPAVLVQNYTLADGTRMEVMAGPLPARVSAEPLVPVSDGAEVRLVPSEAPLATPAKELAATRIESSALVQPSGPGQAPPGFAGYDPFYGHAVAQGTLPVTGTERRSALLANPGTLKPDTRACSVHPAAVLIDLDPGTGVFDPAAAINADPRLVNTLAALRAQGLAIGWLTAATADRAGAIRRALVGSGLDPFGRDELALLRYPEERKQTRREDFAKQFCVVAIAGDERGDFDELFQYLKDPAVAAPLEALVGKGWFLIPQPLS